MVNKIRKQIAADEKIYSSKKETKPYYNKTLEKNQRLNHKSGLLYECILQPNFYSYDYILYLVH